jgi:uncharacterized protein (DUF2141 family)
MTNMRKIFRILFTMIFFVTVLTVPAQTYTITVTYTGLRNDQGKLYSSLYNSPEGYPKQVSAAFKLSSSQILHGTCRIVYDNIPKGIYAIACYHDENDNGKIDRNFFGVPTEGTGASNNARGFWGPPKFTDAQFLVSSDIKETIQIYY